MSRISPGVVALWLCLAAPAIALPQQSAGTAQGGTQQTSGTSSPLGPQQPLGASQPAGQPPPGTSGGDVTQQQSGTTHDDGTEPPPPGSRSNGAVFGGADTASMRRSRALDLSLSLATAYDDDLTEGQGAAGVQPQVGGEFSDVSALLSFRRAAPHVRMNGRAATSLRHYPSLNRLVGSSHSAGTDFSFDVTRRTTLHASVDGTHVSEFAFDTISRQSGLGNAALVSTGLEATALDGARVSYGAATQLTRKIGLRSMLSLNLGARANERRTFDESVNEETVGGYFGHQAGRYTSIGFGYSHRTSLQRLGGQTRPISGDDLQVGMEHRWRHARQRRTVVSLSIGPSLVRSTVDSRAGDSGDRLGLVGSAAISHDMSRSWNLGASFRRAGGSIDGVRSDSASVDLRGLLSRRTDLTLSAGYLGTDIALGAGDSQYTTLFGSSRVQLALSRTIAFYAQYVFYDYDLGTAIPLVAAGLQQQQQRRGIRAGLTLWMPLHEGR
jgi:hypothetical protein